MDAPLPRITRLTLSDFRSYHAALVETDAPMIVIAGSNGIGKTNMLEALSLLAPGRGLRGASRTELERHGTTHGWAVAAALATRDGLVRIGVGTTATARERRQVRIEGEAATMAELARLITPLWLTPAQDRLFAEAPGERRRFLDRLVQALYPDHGGHVARYETAMRERMTLLTQGNADARWLTALEQTAAEQGIAVAAARVDLVTALQQVIDARPDSVFPKADLRLCGETEQALMEGSAALLAEDALRASLANARSADALAGRALSGVHRTDLQASHRGKAMPAALCSTGEQKALVVGLLLAQARLLASRQGRAPLLLLDEIAAHLDAERRSGLFDELKVLGCQCWMTGTDQSAFNLLNENTVFLTVTDGQILRLDISQGRP
jgi:DNA replication and repair protein RecF